MIIGLVILAISIALLLAGAIAFVYMIGGLLSTTEPRGTIEHAARGDG